MKMMHECLNLALSQLGELQLQKIKRGEKISWRAIECTTEKIIVWVQVTIG